MRAIVGTEIWNKRDGYIYPSFTIVSELLDKTEILKKHAFVAKFVGNIKDAAPLADG